MVSLAAHVAVGGPDPIGRRWPGGQRLSMLVSVKLLFGMIDHGRDDQRTVQQADPSLSRDALADGMRDDGHGVCNARASPLLKILRVERDAGRFVLAGNHTADARTNAANPPWRRA
ncbi:hypothetical protein ONA91_33970 [Micromonospora sp. DR5-3]|uniref:hypothetical protein n=1 Tax=unclassified Micromonospora TaxID=2617518 RepID=UPI0011D4FF1A|nr:MULTISPECIES: hypothetical protein [unclassified Micromonospora]MCW3819462.1 hypothetical protein [Micromonospora sp. DR5-3]TYC20758.1 hypothetical protein FXF52_29465 [Micromonospora sp. MP36]